MGENPVFEFLSNMTLVNAVLSWRWDVFVDGFQHLILPAVALATIPMAIIARMTRSSLVDVLGLDYVRTARAKGMRERIAIGIVVVNLVTDILYTFLDPKVRVS